MKEKRVFPPSAQRNAKSIEINQESRDHGEHIEAQLLPKDNYDTHEREAFPYAIYVTN